MAVLRPSYSSTDKRTASNASSSSCLSSSSLHLITLSMMVLRTLDNRLVMALPATSAKDAMARALKPDMGDLSNVGNRLGKIMFDRALSVSRVRRAESAFCASSSLRSKANR